MRALVLVLVVLIAPLRAQERPSSCDDCPTWNLPQAPFRIYGNTYYVGTRGLSAILVTSPAGHILIDGALPESVPHIATSIRALGFRLEDVKLILNSHPHFDHAGGIAELQRLTGATVTVSAWSAEVMKRGVVPKDDPQFGIIVPIRRVARVGTLKDGETVGAGGVKLTAHFTPGHTPGGTSWSWRSCEANRCLDLVYADSVTAVSAEGFLFTRSRADRTSVADFEKSYVYLERAPCDILLTPHPEASNLWPRLEQRAQTADAMIDPSACRNLAVGARRQLAARLERERNVTRPSP